MSRSLLLSLLLLVVIQTSVHAEDLTLVIEGTIFDCMACPELFEGLQQPGQDLEQREKLLARLRKEARVRDTFRSVLLLPVGQTVMHQSVVNNRLLKIVATAQQQLEDGRYPVQITARVMLPPQKGGLLGMGGGGAERLAPNAHQVLSTAAAWNGQLKEFGTISAVIRQGKPDEFQDLWLNHLPPALPAPPQARPDAAAAAFLLKPLRITLSDNAAQEHQSLAERFEDANLCPKERLDAFQWCLQHPNIMLVGWSAHLTDVQETESRTTFQLTVRPNIARAPFGGGVLFTPDYREETWAYDKGVFYLLSVHKPADARQILLQD